MDDDLFDGELETAEGKIGWIVTTHGRLVDRTGNGDYVVEPGSRGVIVDVQDGRDGPIYTMIFPESGATILEDEPELAEEHRYSVKRPEQKVDMIVIRVNDFAPVGGYWCQALLYTSAGGVVEVDIEEEEQYDALAQAQKALLFIEGDAARRRVLASLFHYFQLSELLS
jgi:hypothetical protein